ncbi:MAG: 2Fe-2S iron-sulfur cluster-binding protein [Planctomycetota bacterium]
MIKLKINGQEVEVEKGTTVLQAAALIGIEIPHFCYHPALKKVGSCRMCQVEFTAPGRPYVGISCRTDVVDGMVVETHSEAAINARKATLEFLLTNHPLDCPICDKAGECPLQNYTFIHGPSTSRYDDPRRKYFKRKHLGGHIIYDAERCILCTRCVRFMADYAKAPQLLVEGRGDSSVINIFADRALDSNYTGNVADICPVGALTLEEFRFKVRTWYLDPIPSVCPYCSRGCNINLEVRKSHNRLFRVRPRENWDVNGYFICNEGRFRPLEATDGKNRLLECTVNNQKSSYLSAVQKAAELIKGHDGKLLVVASSRRTVEELYLITKLFKSIPGVRLVAAAPDTEAPDGILRTGANAPNERGLLAFGYEVLSLEALGEVMAGKETDGLVMLDASINLDERMRESFRFILFMDYIATGVSEIADVVIPGLAWFEKEGTFINVNHRIQRIRKALKPPAPTLKDDLYTFAELYRRIHDQELPQTAMELFDALAEEYADFKGIDYKTIGTCGASLSREGGE